MTGSTISFFALFKHFPSWRTPPTPLQNDEQKEGLLFVLYKQMFMTLYKTGFAFCAALRRVFSQFL